MLRKQDNCGHACAVLRTGDKRQTKIKGSHEGLPAIENTKTRGRRASVVAKTKRSNHKKYRLYIDGNARIHALRVTYVSPSLLIAR